MAGWNKLITRGNVVDRRNAGMYQSPVAQPKIAQRQTGVVKRQTIPYLTPQQIQSIKNSPQGVLPNFIKSSRIKR